MNDPQEMADLELADSLEAVKADLMAREDYLVSMNGAECTPALALLVLEVNVMRERFDALKAEVSRRLELYTATFADLELDDAITEILDNGE